MSDPYRRTARFYDALVEPPNVILRRIGLEMCPPREGMKVLEVGCGTGINLRLYENAGCDVFGVDLSPAMLEMARQKLGERADLRLADAAEMPYADDSFDLVTAFLTLHEMPAATRTAVMAEMVRVVNRDGRLLLIDYRSGPIRFPKGWLFKAGWQRALHQLPRLPRPPRSAGTDLLAWPVGGDREGGQRRQHARVRRTEVTPSVKSQR